MNWKIEIIPRDKQQTTAWAGGTTTQLAIDPSCSQYQERNFRWRISTATITLEESEFTVLPEYQRILMVLEGQIELCHQGSSVKILKPFEQDYFEGSWHTVSRGIGRDFNVIYQTDCLCQVVPVTLMQPLTFCVTEPRPSYSGQKMSLSLYMITGKLQVICPGGKVSLNLQSGELLLASNNWRKKLPQIQFIPQGNQVASFIQTIIWYA